MLEALAQGPPLPEVLPVGMLRRLGLPGRLQALRETHFPPEGTAAEALQEFRTAAQQRLVFEELFYLELGLELKRKRLRERDGNAFQTGDERSRGAEEGASLSPHGRAKASAGRDCGRHAQAHTPCDACCRATWAAARPSSRCRLRWWRVENGSQAVLMAPTEILATQHYLSAKKLLENVAYGRTGSRC